jgi:oligopeptide/dipeptide ABC transporter ATP-binding protein
MPDLILSVRGLSKDFFVTEGKGISSKKKTLKAVDNISFDVYRGETFGIVGESGCGKSTTGMMLLGLTAASKGEILFEGEDLCKLSKAELRKKRKDIQITFQDPYSSLNPRMRVSELIAEPMTINKTCPRDEIKMHVDDLMQKVGLSAECRNRFPHEFSGGQKQRIVIARALSLNPKLLVLDEPVSALDVSVQSQILNLLKDLQDKLSLTYVFIAHGMNVVKYMSDRVAVMYLGNVVETAYSSEIYSYPLHPYTIALFSAIPTLDANMKERRVRLEGDIPSPVNRPSGCPFHTRCPRKQPRCMEDKPELVEVRENHFVACHIIETRCANVY